MRIGAALTHDWLEDLAQLESLVQRLEDGGFDVVTTSGHILTADGGRYPDRPEGTYAAVYRDPFVLFTHLAARTQRLTFRTSILILPLYPTALVARQAADLSALSGGRIELGIGISWQPAEYAALGQDFRTRGARVEEQIEVLRLLWSAPLVSFHGRFHEIDGLGLSVLPPRPIPILIGCAPLEPLLRRVARLGDGWLPNVDPTGHVGPLLDYTREAGREPSALTIVGRVPTGPSAPAPSAEAARLRAAGATELTIFPPPGASPDEALAALLAARTAIMAAG